MVEGMAALTQISRRMQTKQRQSTDLRLERTGHTDKKTKYCRRGDAWAWIRLAAVRPEDDVWHYLGSAIFRPRFSRPPPPPLRISFRHAGQQQQHPLATLLLFAKPFSITPPTQSSLTSTYSRGCQQCYTYTAAATSWHLFSSMTSAPA